MPAEFLFHLGNNGQDRGRAPAADRPQPDRGDAVLDGNDFKAVPVQAKGGGDLRSQYVFNEGGIGSSHAVILAPLKRDRCDENQGAQLCPRPANRGRFDSSDMSPRFTPTKAVR